MKERGVGSIGGNQRYEKKPRKYMTSSHGNNVLKIIKIEY